jgi:[ribosomal protein S5]-alanine N-acetyltransferase
MTTVWLPPEKVAAANVALRPATPADAMALFAIARDPEVMRYMDWAMPRMPSATLAHLEGAHARWNAGTEFQWIIEERATGGCVGTIAFRPNAQGVDFGYFLAREHWGKSYAFEAATALLAWFDEQPEVARILATVDVDNARSRRLLERLGLRLDRIEPRATLRPNVGGPPRDTAIYARRSMPSGN